MTTLADMPGALSTIGLILSTTIALGVAFAAAWSPVAFWRLLVLTTIATGLLAATLDRIVIEPPRAAPEKVVPKERRLKAPAKLAPERRAERATPLR